MSLLDVKRNLRKQHDVKSVSIVSIFGKRLVKARISNELHDGTKYNRIAYYDADGNHVEKPSRPNTGLGLAE